MGDNIFALMGSSDGYDSQTEKFKGRNKSHREIQGEINLTADVSYVGHSGGEADLPPWKTSIAYTCSAKEAPFWISNPQSRVL
eukprot:1392379-Amorphochlora_amoeboformis.AAC.1